uniref:Butyrophilin subfamily 1 member A1-like n=1 Tax=Geotrypetes seraphini TaxID=260995 RepID=A0A6P8P9J1_GEOSA|nr:butyrophilin subfamily 1 member A1-like [Geotrypetes seraphini]
MYFPDAPWRRTFSSLQSFILLLISHHFQIVHTERFKVIGPGQPVVAVLGENVVLPCHLDPVLSAERMQVRWFQTRFDLIVHLYENGKDRNKEQIPEYRDRTELIRKDISCGSVSLRIYNIQLDDTGSYTCFFQSDTYYEEATLELKVANTFFHQVSRWVSSLSIILPLIFLCSLLVVWVIYHVRNERQEKDSLRRELEWRRCCSYAVNVVLDPETVHPDLILSEDRKSVRHGDTRQNLPDNFQRFDTWLCVLGCENFTSGRHYWEVEVGDMTDWDLGVCNNSVSRKGWITQTPERGYWTLRLRYGNEYKACTSSRTLLPLSVKPQAVGIFLDYEAGKVSFYNPDNRSHLFTFTHPFTDKLLPYFDPYLHREGANAGALRIRPVPDWE